MRWPGTVGCHQCREGDERLESHVSAACEQVRVAGAEDGDAKSYIGPFLEPGHPRQQQNANASQFGGTEKIGEIDGITKVSERIHHGWHMRERKYAGSSHNEDNEDGGCPVDRFFQFHRFFSLSLQKTDGGCDL